MSAPWNAQCALSHLTQISLKSAARKALRRTLDIRALHEALQRQAAPSSACCADPCTSLKDVPPSITITVRRVLAPAAAAGGAGAP